MGYQAGISLYSYVGSKPIFATDPNRLDGRLSANNIIIGGRFGRVCAFHGLDHDDRRGSIFHPCWKQEASRVADDFHEPGVESPQQILDFVKSKGFCTLYFVGHQGGNLRLPNLGGAVTYPYPSNPTKSEIIFPDEKLEEGLKNLFFNVNRCKHCAINLVTCGDTSDAHRNTRKLIAKRTGCLVCGSTCTISAGRTCQLDCGAYDTPWPHECEVPPARDWIQKPGPIVDRFGLVSGPFGATYVDRVPYPPVYEPVD